MQMRLRDKAKQVDRSALIAQRLKRVPAIIYKLGRGYDGKSPSMNLSQMQDIGGCRAVLSDAKSARKLWGKHYLKGELKHKLMGRKDYVTYPKKDGYRSLHLVYAYKSDKGKKAYNGLKVELQIRSKLQHLWSTSVETVDFFTKQAIKFSRGHPDWADFFRLVSSAFALMEESPLVQNTPVDKKELYSLIKEKEVELKVMTKMAGWTKALRLIDEEIRGKKKKSAKFFILELDIQAERLDIRSYSKESEQKAIKDYSELEEKHRDRKEYDVVLVGAETTNDLKKTYPNYFVDTREFIKYLKLIVNKA